MDDTERRVQDAQVDATLIDALADRLGDVIAGRVIEAIKSEVTLPQATPASAWLDAHQLAQRLGVSREWVYEHADELGASRIGSGPRPRLRFPPDLLERQANHPQSPELASRPGQRRPKPSGLIPIHAS